VILEDNASLAVLIPSVNPAFNWIRSSILDDGVWKSKFMDMNFSSCICLYTEMIPREPPFFEYRQTENMPAKILMCALSKKKW
jgi:hypothetical protein